MTKKEVRGRKRTEGRLMKETRKAQRKQKERLRLENKRSKQTKKCKKK